MSSWEIKTDSKDCQYSGYPYLVGDGYRCDHPKNNGKECMGTLCPIAVLTNAMHSNDEDRCTTCGGKKDENPWCSNSFHL